MQGGELCVLVQPRDDRGGRGVDLLEEAKGPPHLLVADAGLGLEQLVERLLLLDAREGERVAAIRLGRQQASHDLLDVLADLGLGKLGHHRAFPARGGGHGLVHLHMPQIFEGVAEAPAGSGRHLRAELGVRGRPGLRDDEAWAVGGHPLRHGQRQARELAGVSRCGRLEEIG